jgi:hypothetical protein
MRITREARWRQRASRSGSEDREQPANCLLGAPERDRTSDRICAKNEIDDSWSALSFEESRFWTATPCFCEEDGASRRGGPGRRGYPVESRRRVISLLAWRCSARSTRDARRAGHKSAFQKRLDRPPQLVRHQWLAHASAGFKLQTTVPQGVLSTDGPDRALRTLGYDERTPEIGARCAALASWYPGSPGAHARVATAAGLPAAAARSGL